MPGWSKDRSYGEINASYRPIFSSFGFYDRLLDKFWFELLWGFSPERVQRVIEFLVLLSKLRNSRVAELRFTMSSMNMLCCLLRDCTSIIVTNEGMIILFKWRSLHARWLGVWIHACRISILGFFYFVVMIVNMVFGDWQVSWVYLLSLGLCVFCFLEW